MNKTYDIAHVFGNNLRVLRNQQNISQLELALRAGRSQTFINNIENGKKWPSDKTIALLCRELSALPYQFFITDDAPDLKAGYTVNQQQEKVILDLYEILSKYQRRDPDKK